MLPSNRLAPMRWQSRTASRSLAMESICISASLLPERLSSPFSTAVAGNSSAGFRMRRFKVSPRKSRTRTKRNSSSGFRIVASALSMLPRRRICLRRLRPSLPRRVFSLGGPPRWRNFCYPCRPKLHFPCATDFGAQSAPNATVSGSAQIQASSPPSVTSGVVNLTSYFQDGWLAIAPDAFSYGPQILQLLPNAGTNTGGDSVQIYGYGFGSNPAKITVKIGGRKCGRAKVEGITSIASSLGLDAGYPFSLERITLQTPPGTSGKADVFVSAPAGSATSPKSFQYLQSVQSYANLVSSSFCSSIKNGSVSI